MSELKVYRDPKDGPAYREFYEKSEADKVIAELKKKIEEQKRLRDMALASVPNALKFAKIIQHNKYKRCLLYAKNHKNLADLATDAARLIGLNAHAFTKETETACVAYWNRIGDCHRRHHDEWLELAEEPTWAKFLQLIHKEAK